MRVTDENPAVAGGASEAMQAAGRPLPIIPADARDPEPATLPEFTPEVAAQLVNRVPVVVTHVYGERHVRRVHMTLAAAHRAVERAEDRGHQAYIILSRIVPEAVVS